MNFSIHHGDCRDVLETLEANSVHAVVTDPPYGLGFMGKGWDHGVPGVEFWTAIARVMRPGAYLVAFGGTRTYHRLACAIEDAGFEIRDQLAWVYGSGFPKGTDKAKIPEGWQGWNTALKPAWEPIVLARTPMKGSLATNLQMHGCGAMNIEGCRIPSGEDHREKCESVVGLDSNRNGHAYGEWSGERESSWSPAGRWPANLMHDGSDEVLARLPESDSKGGGGAPASGFWGNAGACDGLIRDDDGSAARFFYCAKADREDRNDGLGGLPLRKSGLVSNTSGQHITRRDGGAPPPSANHHPTVKPTDLMVWLCKLVTPPGGIILDPFMGSGSTGRGAALGDFSFIGIEQDAEYVEIARRRIRAISPLFIAA